jgi:NAD(P) transhydrogenase
VEIMTTSHSTPSHAPSFDVVVLGGGPAGASGAAAAAVFGQRVALVEQAPEVGGAGVMTGTLPSKTLRETAGRARYADNPRSRIIGDDTGFLKLLFRREDMRLLGVHVIGEQATEVVHTGIVAMLAEAGADLFNRACFNYPTLGDLYKYATYDALLQRAKLGRIPA